MKKQRAEKIGLFILSCLLPTIFIFAKESQEQAPVLLDEVRIEGEIKKPEAYFILQHKNFDELLNNQIQPKFDALEKIVTSVTNDIF